jgi:O-antigen ligase
MKLLVLPASLYFRHPQPRLQAAWNGLQLAVLLLPFSALLGSLGLLGTAIALWSQHFARIVRRPINQALAVLSLLLLLSSWVAFQPAVAAIGLFNFLPFFLIFAGLSELLQTPEQLRRLAQIIVWGSIPVVFLGLGQQFFGWSGHVQILWLLADWHLAPTGNPPGRMASLFYYANVLASYLVITFILNLGLWIEAIVTHPEGRAVGSAAHSSAANVSAQAARAQSQTLPARRRVRAKILDFSPYGWMLTIALLGNASALILTNSRNAWIVACLAGIAFAVHQGWRWILAAMGAIATTILGAAFAPAPIHNPLRRIVPAFFWARLNDQMYPNRPVGDLRSTQWHFAWELAQQRPWTGWGLRNFSPLYTAKMQFFIGHPHNLFLMLTAETGFPATLLLYAIAGWIIVQFCIHLMTTSLNTTASPPLPLFTVLTTFLAITLFSFLDITLFDVRLNLLGWLLLASLNGIVYHSGRLSGRELGG